MIEKKKHLQFSEQHNITKNTNRTIKYLLSKIYKKNSKEYKLGESINNLLSHFIKARSTKIYEE